MNEPRRKLSIFSQEVTDSVLPAEGSLFKLMKSSERLVHHFSKTKTEWEKTQLILSVT